MDEGKARTSAPQWWSRPRPAGPAPAEHEGPQFLDESPSPADEPSPSEAETRLLPQYGPDAPAPDDSPTRPLPPYGREGSSGAAPSPAPQAGQDAVRGRPDRSATAPLPPYRPDEASAAGPVTGQSAEDVTRPLPAFGAEEAFAAGPEAGRSGQGPTPPPAPDAASGAAPGVGQSAQDTTYASGAVPAYGADASSGAGTGAVPLHAPDPYGTPPYGRPGPWAPAPPVQRPVTPPQGTLLPPAGPVVGPPAPQGAAFPSSGMTPPQGTPLPPAGPAAPQGAAFPPPGVTPPHGTPVPPVGMTPAHGTPGPWQYDPWAAASAARAAEPVPGKRGRGRLLAGALLVALVAGGIGGGVGAYLERDGAMGRHVSLPQATADRSARAPGSIAGIAARALPGVVTIHVRGGSDQGTGTGFVLDKEGRILTNNHVVEPAGAAGDISVTFSSGQTAKATLVGRDSSYDLAVIKVSGVSGLTPLALGNSDSVRVGDSVIAIGAPYDLAGTVTTGIISAKERPITAGGRKGDGSDVSYVDALQTDAPINPGNSGGPLVDSEARVIGINSAIRSAGDSGDLGGGQGGSIGLGFAIPINQAKRVAEELINTGKATHPVIGVTLDMGYSGDGARVNTKSGDSAPVTPGGPGDKAGLRANDVIKKVDGVAVHSGQELIVKIRSHRPGDRLTLTVERDGRERAVELTLGSAGAR
ncbi:trypsin-like peptidase domain-containing protein [Streptomyces roseifaciens]|uniref:trypsin-like peptidase domain-containing protein n=1 Tax=Streptomyces roseifaciens TaxID=1488406 RepID=UPI0007182EF0|nr:trypsin-like peptidase domain-containing protein [Streptomyces roseifaciens]